jgi:hypothetical protein
MNVSYAVSRTAARPSRCTARPTATTTTCGSTPEDNTRMIIADDGGAQVSTDGGDSWTTYHNQPTAQFYRIATDDHFPYRIYGAQQDNSSIRILAPQRQRDHRARLGGHGRRRERLPRHRPGGSRRRLRRQLQGLPLSLQPRERPAPRRQRLAAESRGSGVEVMKYRFNWNFPTFFSHHDPDRLYAFSHRVHVSTNEGQSWETISPDLTRAIPRRWCPRAGPSPRTTAAWSTTPHPHGEREPAREGRAVDRLGRRPASPDPRRRRDLAGRDAAGRPASCSCGTPSTCTPRTRRRLRGRHDCTRAGDFTPYLYKTTDYGRTWTKITDGIDPDALHARAPGRSGTRGPALRGHRVRHVRLLRRRDSWQPFQLNLPEVPITDLQVRDRNLIVATQGRSFWIIDDLSPLHQLDEFAAGGLPSVPAQAQLSHAPGGRGRRDPLLQGENHPPA